MSSRRWSRAVTARTAATPPTASPPRMTPWETRVPRAPASRPITRSSPRSSALAANCSPVVAAAKPSPDAAPMPTATAEALSPTPATACRSGATTPYLAARRLRLRMLMATTVPPVTTDGRRVVSRPGFMPSRRCRRASHADAAPPARAAKAVMRPAVATAAAGRDSSAFGPAIDAIASPAVMPAPAITRLARVPGRWPGHGAGGLQGRPCRGGQLVVRRRDHAGGDRLLDGVAGEQAARERPGHGPGGAGDARLRRRVGGPPGQPLGSPEERHGDDSGVGDVRPWENPDN